MKMRSYGNLSSPLARLTTIAEHTDENIATQPSAQTDSQKSNVQTKKSLPKRSMSCIEFTKPADYPPLLRRSQSETNNVEKNKYTAKTYTDFLQTVEPEGESENNITTEDAFKQGKETLDRWMKFFG